LSVCNLLECFVRENFLTQKPTTLENEGKLIVTGNAVSHYNEVKGHKI